MEEEIPVYVPEYADRPNKWPVIWGVVAIVFGVFGALSQSVKVIQTSFMMAMPMSEIYANSTPKTGDPKQDKMMEEMMQGQAEMMKSIQDASPMLITVSSILALIAILLFVGGILLCMRKRIASPFLQTWAVLKIIVGGVGIWIGYKMTGSMMGGYGQMMNSITSSAGPGASGVTDFGRVMGIFANVMFFLSFAWLLALPVFFLVWFNREIVKEDMKNGIGW